MKTLAELAFTPAVQTLQERHGSRAAYARMQARAQPGEGLGSREVEHLSGVDSFYIATVSETGWPYIQHRGGPRGFLKVLSPTQLAFADFSGNRQFVSVGHPRRSRVTHRDGLSQPAAAQAHGAASIRSDRRRGCRACVRGGIAGLPCAHRACRSDRHRSDGLELPAAHRAQIHPCGYRGRRRALARSHPATRGGGRCVM